MRNRALVTCLLSSLFACGGHTSFQTTGASSDAAAAATDGTAPAPAGDAGDADDQCNGKCGPGLTCETNLSDRALHYCATAVGAGAACDFQDKVCDVAAGLHCDYEKRICVPPGDTGFVCIDNDFVPDCAEGLDCHVETTRLGVNIGHCRLLY